MSSIDPPTSGPKGLNIHAHSEQAQPSNLCLVTQTSLRRVDSMAHLKSCCGYAFLDDNVVVAFDDIATTSANRLIVQGEILSKLILLKPESRPKGVHKA
jgi:hypothetical protein